MSECPTCGAALPSGATTCPACGSGTVGGRLANAEAPTEVAPRASTPSPSSNASGAHFQPGYVLGQRYRIVAFLGRGGMGEVYRADDLRLGQSVALKFLSRARQADETWMQRFVEEVRIARQVTHPNVCRVHDIEEMEGRLVLSMEYVDGEDLASLLRRIGRLPQDRAVEVARQLCSGLAAAHRKGILHRDLKPANVMLDGEGQVRITDFGLAGVAEEIAGQRATVGTPEYMAPEQFDGEPASVQSDLFSLGLVLYELFTGQRAFEARELGELRDKMQQGAVSAPSRFIDGLDPSTERILLACLEPDPARRPATAMEIALALPGGDPLAAALAAGETPSPEVVARSRRGTTLRAPFAVTLAIAAVFLFYGATHWMGQHSIFAYLPFDTPPSVLIDRAQQILKDAGYTEEAWTRPADRAWGFRVWGGELYRAREDSRTDPWAPLRDRPEAVTFWYRQSPRFYLPAPNTAASFAHGMVRIGDPPLAVPGEVLIGLDLRRRLERFEVLPRRFAAAPPADRTPRWGTFLAEAGLDTTELRPVPPQLYRVTTGDRRWAWLQTRTESAERRRRIEASSAEGRPTLFLVARESDLESLAGPIRPAVRPSGWQRWADMIILAALFAAMWIGRTNLRRGRADRRGATRVALLYFSFMVCVELLRSHVLYNAGDPDSVFFMVATAMFWATTLGLAYLAIEPYGRRIWPTMFVGSTRLLSVAHVQLRDPLIGRSVLFGLLAGGVNIVLHSVLPRVLARPFGYPVPSPFIPDLDTLVSLRQAIVWPVWAALADAGRSFLLVGFLLTLRAITRRTRLSVVLAVLMWALVGRFSPWAYVFALAVTAVQMTVLLRYGLLALFVASGVAGLARYAQTDDLSAWYSQSAVIALLLVTALAAYGAWAASPAGETGD